MIEGAPMLTIDKKKHLIGRVKTSARPTFNYHKQTKKAITWVKKGHETTIDLTKLQIAIKERRTPDTKALSL